MRPERVAYEEEEDEEEEEEDDELLFQRRKKKDRGSFHKRTSQRGRVNRVAFPSPVIPLLFPPSGQERAYQRRRPSFEKKRKKNKKKKKNWRKERKGVEKGRGKRGGGVEGKSKWKRKWRDEEFWPVNGVIILSRFKGST